MSVYEEERLREKIKQQEAKNTFTRPAQMPFLLKYLTKIPLCQKCIDLRKISKRRDAEYLRCEECSEKICKSYIWVKCPDCGEEFSYLVDRVSGMVDYQRTGENTICAGCRNRYMLEEKQRQNETERENNRKSNKKQQYKDYTNEE